MLKKMNEKKNNKGFSLVELIVVILIMAVLAVAIAPQVMKWVNNSRIAADVQTQDSVVAAAQLALTDNNIYTSMQSKSVTITVSDSNVVYSSGTPSNFETEMNKTISQARAKNATFEVYVNNCVVSKSAIDASAIR